jgi:C_GCAxxG_C_C family probable redox protein
LKQVDQAVARFAGDCNCAQAVLGTYGPSLGLDADLCMKIGAPLGAGLARQGRTCGAVTAGLILIGTLQAPDEAGDRERRGSVYELGADFVAAFEAKSGSSQCRDLLGCDMGTESGRRQASEEGLHEKVCARLVGDAAELFEQFAAAFTGTKGV